MVVVVQLPPALDNLPQNDHLDDVFTSLWAFNGTLSHFLFIVFFDLSRLQKAH